MSPPLSRIRRATLMLFLASYETIIPVAITPSRCKDISRPIMDPSQNKTNEKHQKSDSLHVTIQSLADEWKCYIKRKTETMF